MRMLRAVWPGIRFSSVYRTAPQLLLEQPAFLNAVAEIHVDKSPREVLAELRRIEVDMGKQTAVRYGPRTIDLDVLLHDDLVLEEEGLTVPHPRLHERRFVLEPLCELLDDEVLVHPVLGTDMRDLLRKTSDQECERVSEA